MSYAPPLSSARISHLKNDGEAFLAFLREHQHSDKTIIYALQKLGRLDNAQENKSPLLAALHSHNETIRSLAIKNLAKIHDLSLLPHFTEAAHSDSSEAVRREATAAIGRLRNPQTIATLIELLSDSNPEIVLQAMRGLLVFAEHPQANAALLTLAEHPNELIQAAIKKHSKQFKHGRAHAPHAQFPAYLKNTIVQGDVCETLQHVEDDAIHLTFTSPPYYNARDYSIYQSYEAYLNFLEKVFAQVHRTTKEGRFLIVNTSPVIIPRISRAHASKRYPIPYDLHPRLVQQGWEFIDDIVWVKPETSVKNRNAGFLQHRKPLAYKPNAISEMLMVYRKQSDNLIDWNIRQYDNATVQQSKVLGNYETSNVWHIAPTFNKTHSAVFPIELCQRVIAYYSFVGDVVFDPFAGSGTVGKAAAQLKRHFFLTEKSPQYASFIKRTITKKQELFAHTTTKPVFLELPDFAQKTKV